MALALSLVFACASHAAAVVPGFYQKLYTTGQLVTTGDPETDDGNAVVDAAGLTFAGNSYTYGGKTYTVGGNTTAAYVTYMAMTAGTTYRFVKNYDDAGRIVITDPDGTETTLLSCTSYNADTYGHYTPTVSGWYRLDLRVGNGGGGVGPTKTPFSDLLKAGLAWTDSAEVTSDKCTTENYTHWKRFENVGANYFYTGKMGIYVAGEPSAIGNPEPGYGMKTFSTYGESCTFTCPAVYTNDAGTIGATSLGYRFELTNGTAVAGAAVSTSIVYSVEAANSTLTWRWDAHFKATIAQPTYGTVTQTSADSWYDAGATATFTATPNANCSVFCWLVDGVRTGYGQDSLSLAMDAPHEVSAVINRAWYVAPNGSDTDNELGDADHPFATIANALAHASDDSKVILGEGTMNLGGLVTLDRAIVIAGAGMGRTILTNGTTSAIFCLNHADAFVSDLTVSNCTSKASTDADSMPGVLASILSNGGTLSNVRFTYCKTTVGYSLGALGIRAGLIDGCVLDHFSCNQQNGGMIHARGGTVRNSLVAFCGSGGIRDGASLYLHNGSSAVIRNCTFYGNIADQTNANTPGCYWYQSPNARVEKCVFAKNTSYYRTPFDWDVKRYGGTVQQYTNSFTDCVVTFPTNRIGSGALVYANEYADPDAMDFRQKRSSPIYGRGYAVAPAADCDMWFSAPSSVVGRNVVVTGAVANATASTAYEWTISDPSHAAADVVKTGASVSFTSEIVGTRTVTLVAKDGATQIGTASESYRFGPATNYLAAADASVPASAEPYDTEATACTKGLQAIYDYAVDGATIVLLPGTHYTSNTVAMTRPIVVTGRDGASATTLARDPACTSSGATKSAYYSRAIRMGHRDAVLDGVTLQSYRGTTSPGVTMLIDGAGGSLTRSRLTDCRGNVFYFLGSLSFNSPWALVRGCMIDRIRGDSEGSGGAVYAVCGTMESSIVCRNTVGWRDMSGVYFAYCSTAVLRNCTIAKNIADRSNSTCSGVYLWQCPSARLINCILAQNSCAYVARGNAWEYYNSGLSTANFTNCFQNCAFGSEATPIGAGSFTFGDDFKDSENDDYHTPIGSSVFDKGIDWAGVDAAVDYDENPRKSGAAVDIGAYEADASQDACEVALSTEGLTTGTDLVLTPTVVGNTNGCVFTYTWTITNDDVPGEAARVVTGNPASVSFATAGHRTVVLRVTKADGSEFATCTKPGAVNVVPTELWLAATGVSVPGSAFPYDTPEKAWTNSLEDLLLGFAVNGGCVRLTAGTHNITSQVSVAKSLTLAGTGVDVSFIYRTTDGPYLKLNDSHATVSNLTLTGRRVGSQEGGAVNIGSSGGRLVGCRVTGFRSSGAYCHAHIECLSSAGLISRCIIDNNVCNNDCWYGTALEATAGTMENCLVYGNLERSDNASSDRPSKICYLNGPVTFRCNTVVSNISQSAAVGSTAGIYLSDKCGSATVVNNIFADGTVGSKSTADPNWNVQSTARTNRFSHCAFASTMERAKATGSDAVFVNDSTTIFRDVGKNNYTLRRSSPVYCRGAYADWMATAKDLAGQPRATPGCKVDIGAYQANHGGLVVIFR